jgi:hypothetical protein
MAALLDYEFEELDEMKARVAYALYTTYGVEPQFFEHGSSADGSSVPCTVNHAHLHAVPIDSLANSLPQLLQWLPVRTSGPDLRLAVGDHEYLYYEDHTGLAFVAISQYSTIESQLLRRVVANKVGVPELWNWRLHPRVPLLQETMTALSDAFGRPHATANISCS